MQEYQKRTLVEYLRKIRLSGGRLLSDDVYNCPRKFCDVFIPELKLYPYQKELLEAVGTHYRNAVYAPRGVGKTCPAALIVLWFALTREARGVSWKTLTIASSWLQVSSYLWPEIHKWASKIDWGLIGVRWNSLQLRGISIQLSYGFAYAASCNDPNKLEGLHAEETLVVGDEMKGQLDAIMDGLEGVGVKGDTRYCYLSTPGAPVGRFYEICSGRYSDWNVIKINHEEALACGAVAQSFIDHRREQWGEESPMYRQHVLGEFAGAESGALFDLAWIDRAMSKVAEKKPSHIGVDVAEYGDDESVIAICAEDGILDIQVYQGSDLMVLTGFVARHLQENDARASVDGIGVGAGVFARLKELDLNVLRFAASGRPKEDLFLNCRAESYWRLRERLQAGDLALPNDRKLKEELLATTWTMTSGGKIKLESKERIKKLIRRSPDRADAVAMAVYTPPPWIRPEDIIFA